MMERRRRRQCLRRCLFRGSSLAYLLATFVLYNGQYLCYAFVIGGPQASRIATWTKKTKLSQHHVTHNSASSTPIDDDDVMENKSREALKILTDYHDGTWEGRALAFSLGPSPDLRGGAIRKHVVQNYETTVKIGLDFQNTEFTLGEKMNISGAAFDRKVESLGRANFDVDIVDGSYSLDIGSPIVSAGGAAASSDSKGGFGTSSIDSPSSPVSTSSLPLEPSLPREIIGTKTPLDFGMEHTLAITDNDRVRVFCFYRNRPSGNGMELGRVVICQEKRRMTEEEKKKDAERRKKSIQFQYRYAMDNSLKIQDLTSILAGIWVGQVELRRPSSYTPRNDNNEDDGEFEIVEGFIERRRSNTAEKRRKAAQKKGQLDLITSALRDDNKFGVYSSGQQRVAHCFEWNPRLSPQIIKKLIQTTGKDDEENPKVVRLPPEQTYALMGIITDEEIGKPAVDDGIDITVLNWMDGKHVGLQYEQFYIQLPQVLYFENTLSDPSASVDEEDGRQRKRRQQRDYFTEISVYQRQRMPSDGENPMNQEGPPMICSMIGRCYDYFGRFKMGQTAFFESNVSG